jgi:hypothetical protein
VRALRSASLMLAIGCCLGVVSCTTAREASRPRATPTPVHAAPTAIAPPAPPGLDGAAGVSGANICTALSAADLAGLLGGGGGRVTVTARPNSWNDAGLPSMDLCSLVVTRTGRPAQTVHVGVSALPTQGASLTRLSTTLGPDPVAAPEIGPDALAGPLGAAFTLEDRAVRVTAAPGLSRADAAAVAKAVVPVLPAALKSARITDGACQPAGSLAEQFLGASALLRRDYRVRGGLTCIWGTTDRTVAITESIISNAVTDPMPEAHRRPRPALAPIGDEGYFLPSEGQLVFRKGKRVVRVSALAEPPVEVTLDGLLSIVEPVMPLFIR